MPSIQLIDRNSNLFFLKKLILLLLLIPSIGYSQYSNSYKEMNIGIFLDGITINETIDSDFSFPGVSFLWGKNKYYQNNVFLDYQVGLALPTIVTGKVGFGISNNSRTIAISSGLRPWPASVYLQLNIQEKVIFSIEPFISNAF